MGPSAPLRWKPPQILGPPVPSCMESVLVPQDTMGWLVRCLLGTTGRCPYGPGTLWLKSHPLISLWSGRTPPFPGGDSPGWRIQSLHPVRSL